MAKAALIYLGNRVDTLMDSDYDKIANKFNIEQTSVDGEYECKYAELVDRLQICRVSPAMGQTNDDERLAYARLIGWIIAVGKRRSNLQEALQLCQYYIRNHQATAKNVRRMGDVLWRHKFNSLTGKECGAILTALYDWMDVKTMKECLKYLDDLGESDCYIQKVRALVIICDSYHRTKDD